MEAASVEKWIGLHKMDDYLKGTYLKKLEEEENAMKTFKIAIKKKKDPHSKDTNKSPHLFTQESQIT